MVRNISRVNIIAGNVPTTTSKIPNPRPVLEVLATKLHIRNKEDWYKISLNKLRLNGVSKLLKLHDNSPSNMLMAAYPEYL